MSETPSQDQPPAGPPPPAPKSIAIVTKLTDGRVLLNLQGEESKLDWIRMLLAGAVTIGNQPEREIVPVGADALAQIPPPSSPLPRRNLRPLDGAR